MNDEQPPSNAQSDAPEPAEQAEDKTLQGLDVPLTSDELRREVFEQALDYRGDVTLHTEDGQAIEGYLYDRSSKDPEPYVRLLAKDDDQRVRIPYRRITRIVFSGKDTASGKSWETWVKKYQEKKAQGEKACLESDSLDDE